MSVYAVYTRTPRRAEWTLREVFTSQEDAKRYAGAAVTGADDGSGQASVESVVVECAQRSDAPAQLPDERAVAVTARFERDERLIQDMLEDLVRG
jgi:hypothetical protein